MEIKVSGRHEERFKKYDKDAIKIARDFSRKAFDELSTIIRGIVVFGSSVRKGKKSGDIDILLIVDDVNVVFARDVVETYRIIIEKVIADMGKKGERLHITTLKFTTFWEYTRVGDPIGINILRDGIALVDVGNFFDPLKTLLIQGRIRPTPESIWTYYTRAPATLHNSNWHILQGTLDLYWAVIDSAHAALMSVGEIPPTPEHVSDLINEKMVKKGLLNKKYADIASRFFHLAKKIEHRELKEISGSEYDKYRKECEDFVQEMKRFIERK